MAQSFTLGVAVVATVVAGFFLLAAAGGGALRLLGLLLLVGLDRFWLGIVATAGFLLAAAAGGAFRLFVLALVLLVLPFFAPAATVTGSCRVGTCGCDCGGCCRTYLYGDGYGYGEN
jgi:hypothetical protein